MKSRPPVLRVVAMLAVLLVFLAQLLAAGVHQHAIADDDADCPTCQLVIDTPSLPPPGDLTVAPRLPGPVYHLRSAHFSSTTQSTTFLIPLSHAPPAHAV
ncbi:hypothetical protein [Duganella sp. Leaf126]|uniref:hypothetical protein n=1 Tax=Duganella sp. Leaf126 TaxID=1736266 RepID=UPI0012E1FA4E|nr:hypothetical protein [Duganella sp. Leaf126]